MELIGHYLSNSPLKKGLGREMRKHIIKYCFSKLFLSVRLSVPGGPAGKGLIGGLGPFKRALKGFKGVIVLEILLNKSSI